MPVITMSRQIGCGAAEVANRVAGTLRLRMFDKTLMMRVASEVGIHENEIVDYSEEEYQARNFFERLFSLQRTVAEVTRTQGISGEGQINTQILDEGRAIALVRATMGAAYERGNVLIIGRGGQAILEDKADVLHVRIVSSLEDRTMRLQERDNLTVPQARRLVMERDRATAEYLRTFHQIDWDDPTLYHLVVNTGRLGIDEAAELIRAAAQGLPQAAS